MKGETSVPINHDLHEIFVKLYSASIMACRDKDPFCEDWAKKGECQKNEGFMSNNCPVSCKECTPPELVGENRYLLCNRCAHVN